jgi:ATP-dependent DNA ligase
MKAPRRKREGIQLAHHFDWKHLLAFPAIACQPKLDGIRAVWKDGKLLSSTEKELTRYPHIVEELKKFDPTIILDGEIYQHGKPFEYISSLAADNTNQYHVFDAYTEATLAVPYYARMDALSLIFNDHSFEHIKRVSTIMAGSDAIEQFVSQALDRAMEAGYEGIIVRNAAAPYELKRTWNMMKLKPNKRDTYKIVGYEQEISQEGEYKGTLGAFICEDDRGYRFNIGTGPMLTKLKRQFFWDNKENLPGQKLVVKYQELTAGRRIPRFPVAMELGE